MRISKGFTHIVAVIAISLVAVLMVAAGWYFEENKVVGDSTKPICDLNLEYSNNAVSPVACMCPAGYEFEVTSTGEGPCPSAGDTDCPATLVKCVPVATTEVDLAPFQETARNATCDDKKNMLYVIDDQLVVWHKSGTCADASYTFVLYNQDPDHVLCRAYDSIAGQQISCEDESYRTMFMTMFQNTDEIDLGLGSDHTVMGTSVKATNTNTNSTAVDTSDWLTYENEELGISFQYPAEYGEVTVTVSLGTEGSKLRGSFSKTDAIIFGGDTKDYSFPSGAGFLDTYGYGKDDDGYFMYLPVAAEKHSVQLIKKVPRTDADGIILTTTMYDIDVTGAIFNLPENIYPGIGFVSRNQDQVSQEEFENVLSTFQFTATLDTSE